MSGICKESEPSQRFVRVPCPNRTFIYPGRMASPLFVLVLGLFVRQPFCLPSIAQNRPKIIQYDKELLPLLLLMLLPLRPILLAFD